MHPPPSPPPASLFQFANPERLVAAIQAIADIAHSEDLPIALAGGCAMALYGSRRLTEDVDVVVSQIPTTICLSGVGTPLVFGGMTWPASNGVGVDWIARDDEFAPLYEEALFRSGRTCAFAGISLPVVPPSYLALMKMVAGREKDDLDFDWLVASPRVALDIEHTRRLASRILGAYAAKDFDARVKVAQWKASRAR